MTIRVSDRAASERFYDAVLGAIAIDRKATGEHYTEWNDFSIAAATAGSPVTRGLHVSFGAKSTGDVDAFWQTGVYAGFESDGEPGPRPIYGDDYYGGFLLDPDGNSVEAVHFEKCTVASTTCGSGLPTWRGPRSSTGRSPRTPGYASRSARAAPSSRGRARARSRC